MLNPVNLAINSVVLIGVRVTAELSAAIMQIIAKVSSAPKGAIEITFPRQAPVKTGE
ncbi:MAG TPA: hypothetical protein V6C84_26800 [Coleofasciculaceae cyanobacterium]